MDISYSIVQTSKNHMLGALFYLTRIMLVVDRVLAPTTVIRHVKSTLRGNDLRLAKKILMLLPAISELLHRSVRTVLDFNNFALICKKWTCSQDLF